AAAGPEAAVRREDGADISGCTRSGIAEHDVHVALSDGGRRVRGPVGPGIAVDRPVARQIDARHDRAAAAACPADAARLAGGADAAVVARGDRERRDAHGRQPGAREARLHLARRAAAVAVGSVAVGDVRRVAVTGAWAAAGNVLGP